MSERYEATEKQVLVVRVPESAGPARDLRDYIIESIQMGVLVLAPGVSYKLEELPNLGGVKIFGTAQDYQDLSDLVTYESGGLIFTESADLSTGEGAEKREILGRLQRYRKAYGAGCLTEVARKSGKGITAETLRDMLIGNVVLTIGDWRKVGRALDKLGWEVAAEEAKPNG